MVELQEISNTDTMQRFHIFHRETLMTEVSVDIDEQQVIVIHQYKTEEIDYERAQGKVSCFLYQVI
jgi:hypothetical protein